MNDDGFPEVPSIDLSGMDLTALGPNLLPNAFNLGVCEEDKITVANEEKPEKPDILLREISVPHIPKPLLAGLLLASPFVLLVLFYAKLFLSSLFG
ncbi:hypothetical protein [Geoalkalibacter subterraneus]|uniref:Uncharacterized protein n=1 Tax=Geoalkalibacter subterraneus TaxID=483547 RepID=A0A0B5FJF5_9BACT|nr:hypothetical protein [Geoalkalibacter subterraneus]AJF08302.1 hypothetical protein GSUB_17675 [Geoalkalibacter subterraneus]